MQSDRYRTIKYGIELIANSFNLHGCVYLSNRRLHISERIIWVLMIQLALFGTIYACLDQYRRYYVRPTLMTVEKDFRSWEGTLPSGTLCFESNLDEEKAERFADKVFSHSGNNTDLDRETFMDFLDALIDATAGNYGRLANFGDDKLLESFNLFDVVMAIRSPMEDRIQILSYDPKVKIRLQPIMLEKGLCYTFNTAVANVAGDKNYRGPILKKSLSCRYGKQECNLKLDLKGRLASLDIHSPYEFSDINSPSISISKDTEIFATFKVMETVAEDSLRELSLIQRKCIFPDEEYPVYGRNICYMKCRGLLALEMCNCIPHFYPYMEGPKCTATGYECLHDFKWPAWAWICNCSRPCIELQYPVDHIIKRTWNADTNLNLSVTSSIMIELTPPKVRNRISVIFSFEDLLVAFGGAASLFLGFSFWAALQSLFYWIKYLTGYLLGVRRKKHRVESVVV